MRKSPCDGRVWCLMPVLYTVYCYIWTHLQCADCSFNYYLPYSFPPFHHKHECTIIVHVDMHMAGTYKKYLQSKYILRRDIKNLEVSYLQTKSEFNNSSSNTQFPIALEDFMITEKVGTKVVNNHNEVRGPCMILVINMVAELYFITGFCVMN